MNSERGRCWTAGQISCITVITPVRRICITDNPMKEKEQSYEIRKSSLFDLESSESVAKQAQISRPISSLAPMTHNSLIDNMFSTCLDTCTIFNLATSLAYEDLANGMDNQHIPLYLRSYVTRTTKCQPKYQIERRIMTYHRKFGKLGIFKGQFIDPSSVAVNAQNDIIVADTKNHRIQVFDKTTRFLFEFGQRGKQDGQLFYPNRVAVVRHSGDIVITERSPAHQVQIYNQYGIFNRKFGADVLKHPRGLCVDNLGRIIVVDCKVMQVFIFDIMGNVLRNWRCSNYLQAPNSVAVNDRQEIFVCDYQAHCVQVFHYEGIYLRKIGGQGVINYPIGVGINSSGEVIIADNHNNFNLSLFSQSGSLLFALKSKVKHFKGIGMCLMDDGSVVLASKDDRLYIYRYTQQPQISRMILSSG